MIDVTSSLTVGCVKAKWVVHPVSLNRVQPALRALRGLHPIQPASARPEGDPLITAFQSLEQKPCLWLKPVLATLPDMDRPAAEPDSESIGICAETQRYGAESCITAHVCR